MPSRLAIFGSHEQKTIAQLERCAAAEDGARAVLCADGHLGYSMPIGGVVGYHRFISPSGVGYDIACGTLAARTGLRASDIGDWTRLAAGDAACISVGLGRAQ